MVQMYEVIAVQVITNPLHSIPCALINNMPQPLLHPEIANGVSIENYKEMLKWSSKFV